MAISLPIGGNGKIFFFVFHIGWVLHKGKLTNHMQLFNLKTKIHTFIAITYISTKTIKVCKKLFEQVKKKNNKAYKAVTI